MKSAFNEESGLFVRNLLRIEEHGSRGKGRSCIGLLEILNRPLNVKYNWYSIVDDYRLVHPSAHKEKSNIIPTHNKQDRRRRH